MNKIEKLLKKINKKERQKLLDIIKKLIKKDTKDLNIGKIKNTDFYRLRLNRFRIIFHFDKKEIFIDSIKLRDEKTYKKR
jgi:mRNA-degrading endonuclease RelE of RelBE toxin-antitoxin system